MNSDMHSLQGTSPQVISELGPITWLKPQKFYSKKYLSDDKCAITENKIRNSKTCTVQHIIPSLNEQMKPEETASFI